VPAGKKPAFPRELSNCRSSGSKIDFKPLQFNFVSLELHFEPLEFENKA